MSLEASIISFVPPIIVFMLWLLLLFMKSQLYNYYSVGTYLDTGTEMDAQPAAPPTRDSRSSQAYRRTKQG